MRKLPLVFTVASVMPFVAAGMAVSMRLFPDNGMVITALLTYATIVLSFLGGVHWGVAVLHYASNRPIANLLITESVLPSLVAWSALFYAPMHIQLLVLTLLFTFIWAIDSVMVGRQIIPLWFFELRSIITPIVVVSLYVAYFGII